MTQFLDVLAWAVTNGQAELTLEQNYWAPLSVAYKKRLIDQLGTIQCQGSKALASAYLVGLGAQLVALDDLMQEYSTNTFVAKYFPGTNAESVEAMQRSTLLFSAIMLHAHS